MKKHCFLYLLSAALLLGCSSKSDEVSFSEAADSIAICEEDVCEQSPSSTVSASEMKCITNEDSKICDSPAISSSQSTSSQPKAQKTQSQPVITKKIVKNGYISLKCDSVKLTKHNIDSLTNSLGGYYVKEEYYCNYEKTYDLTIRIPSKNFDVFMNSAEGKGSKLIQKNVSTLDKTATYQDADSRKKTKEAVAERYRELLKKCNNISDILSVQNRLDWIQEESEAYARKMLLIDDEVNFSTINARLIQERPDYQYNEEDSDSIWKSFKDGWKLAKNTVYFIIKIWPFWIIGGIAFYFIRKRRMNK